MTIVGQSVTTGVVLISSVNTAAPIPYSMEPCVDGGVCNLCGGLACLEHGFPAVICEVNGFTCGGCHQECTSIRCAMEHADPDA